MTPTPPQHNPQHNPQPDPPSHTGLSSYSDSSGEETSGAPRKTPSALSSSDLKLTQTCQLERGALSFSVRGSGPPLLLIMGFMARGRAWSAQIEALSERYQVAWFDHRGVGDSPGPAARSMGDFAADCIALLNELKWESAHICGVSMGGMIAQELALLSPERTRSLSLIVTQPGGILSMLPTLRGLPLFLRAQLARTPDGRIRALRDLLVPPQSQALVDVSEIDRKLVEDFTPKPPTKTRLSHLRAIRRHDTRRRLSQITAPTLVVQAQGDLLVRPKHSETIARLIPDAELVSLPSAGHGVIRQSNTDLNLHLARHLDDAEQRYAHSHSRGE